ncbi:MAG TPA: LysR family transcriptional regulator [Burkholderiaceae bacterium]|nr:LysR family transcriptional regulator [Burkholderiaceae bacterium]
METIETGFDLNLLRVLVALERTRHVSRAAELLGMSQSGFSTALARLRRQCGDLLFVRAAGGMAPTPRAERMVGTAHAVLAQVSEGVFGEPEFRPADSRTEIRLAMADVAEIVFLPRLLGRLQEVAPHVTLTSASYSTDALRAGMADGSIDLALGYFPDLDGEALFRQRFYTHTFACMVRRGHPLAAARRGQLTIQDYLKHGHAAVASPARSNSLLEQVLERRGLRRRVVMRTPHYLGLPAIIESTELVAILPLAAGARFAQMGSVQLLPLPFEPPSFGVQQHWHQRVQHDSRHRWLRATMADLFNEATDEWRDVESALYGKDYRGRQRRRKATRSSG